MNNCNAGVEYRCMLTFLVLFFESVPQRASISRPTTSTEYCDLNELVVLTMLTTVLRGHASISGLTEYCDTHEFVVLTTLTVETLGTIFRELRR
jgi:hypothetical protein